MVSTASLAMTSTEAPSNHKELGHRDTDKRSMAFGAVISTCCEAVVGLPRRLVGGALNSLRSYGLKGIPPQSQEEGRNGAEIETPGGTRAELRALMLEGTTHHDVSSVDKRFLRIFDDMKLQCPAIGLFLVELPAVSTTFAADTTDDAMKQLVWGEVLKVVADVKLNGVSLYVHRMINSVDNKIVIIDQWTEMMSKVTPKALNEPTSDNLKEEMNKLACFAHLNRHGFVLNRRKDFHLIVGASSCLCWEIPVHTWKTVWHRTTQYNRKRMVALIDYDYSNKDWHIELATILADKEDKLFTDTRPSDEFNKAVTSLWTGVLGLWNEVNNKGHTRDNIPTKDTNKIMDELFKLIIWGTDSSALIRRDVLAEFLFTLLMPVQLVSAFTTLDDALSRVNGILSVEVKATAAAFRERAVLPLFPATSQKQCSVILDGMMGKLGTLEDATGSPVLLAEWRTNNNTVANPHDPKDIYKVSGNERVETWMNLLYEANKETRSKRMAVIKTFVAEGDSILTNRFPLIYGTTPLRLVNLPLPILRQKTSEPPISLTVYPILEDAPDEVHVAGAIQGLLKLADYKDIEKVILSLRHLQDAARAITIVKYGIINSKRKKLTPMEELALVVALRTPSSSDVGGQETKNTDPMVTWLKTVLEAICCKQHLTLEVTYNNDKPPSVVATRKSHDLDMTVVTLSHEFSGRKVKLDLRATLLGRHWSPESFSLFQNLCNELLGI
eukprot:GHVS01089933.1.p1 GENE.GHVS01089933.1~~GHVS01089933.1.p1  ORF type:complete len:770 (-),score=67.49 GHVS01089933.1:194-2371(-)